MPPMPHLVEVKEDMGPVTQQQPALPGDALLVQGGQLIEEAGQVHHSAVANDVHSVVIDQAAGQQVEGKLLAVHHHGVACIGTTIEATHIVVAARTRERGEWQEREGGRKVRGAEVKESDGDGGRKRDVRTPQEARDGAGPLPQLSSASPAAHCTHPACSWHARAQDAAGERPALVRFRPSQALCSLVGSHGSPMRGPSIPANAKTPPPSRVLVCLP